MVVLDKSSSPSSCKWEEMYDDSSDWYEEIFGAFDINDSSKMEKMIVADFDGL